jgi:hypothetical protein
MTVKMAGKQLGPRAGHEKMVLHDFVRSKTKIPKHFCLFTLHPPARHLSSTPKISSSGSLRMCQEFKNTRGYQAFKKLGLEVLGAVGLSVRL